MIELTNLAASAMPLDVARPRDAPASEGTDFALIEAALAEHAEWTLMHRERPLPTSRI